MEMAVSGVKLHAIALFHKVAYTKKFKKSCSVKSNFFIFSPFFQLGEYS